MEIKLLQEIKDELIEIRELLQKENSPWLTFEGACAYSGLGESSLRILVKLGLKTYRPVKGRVLFKKKDLDKVIQNSMVRDSKGRPRRFSLKKALDKLAVEA